MNPAQFFATLFHDLKEGETIELRAFNPPRRWWVRNSDEIAQAARECPEDLYFGVNPRMGERGDNEGVSRITVVVADLDDKSSDDTTESLQGYGLVPSAVVSSGGGMHAYWLLDPPVDNTAEFSETRKMFLRSGDSDAVHDAAPSHVTGIRRHLNRGTAQLGGCFLPRFAVV